jgi:hypothetical protein
LNKIFEIIINSLFLNFCLLTAKKIPPKPVLTWNLTGNNYSIFFLSEKGNIANDETLFNNDRKDFI